MLKAYRFMASGSSGVVPSADRIHVWNQTVSYQGLYGHRIKSLCTQNPCHYSYCLTQPCRWLSKRFFWNHSCQPQKGLRLFLFSKQLAWPSHRLSLYTRILDTGHRLVRRVVNLIWLTVDWDVSVLTTTWPHLLKPAYHHYWHLRCHVWPQ